MASLRQLSLLTDGVDAYTQTRFRYHVRATVKEGTKDTVQLTLAYIVLPAILQLLYWRNHENRGGRRCNLHVALAGTNIDDLVNGLFAERNATRQYLERTFGTDPLLAVARVLIYTAVKPVVLHDLHAMVVEDVFVHKLAATTVLPRIVL